MRYMVCTDGSESANKALEKAAMLVKGKEDDTVTLVHIYAYPQVV